MRGIRLPDGILTLAVLGRGGWRAVRVAAAVGAIVATFGYATTGTHNHVLMGVGTGLAIGIGLSLRMGIGSGLSVGILVGSALGVGMVLIGGAQTFAIGPGVYIPPILGLGVGLIAGLGTTRIQTYREAGLESSLICILLAFGVLPALGLAGFVTCLLLMPSLALIAGFFSRGLEGSRYSRPPLLLLIGTLTVSAAVVFLDQFLNNTPAPFHILVPVSLAAQLVIPAIMFFAGRSMAVWLRPRLRVYMQLTAYLRVMWIPIGSFTAGYMTLILLFAGFGGTLERFAPGSFTGAADSAGITDWIAFSFFTALARDYTEIIPVSVGARALVGGHLILSIGWGLVVFAAVMSYIQPQIERIARREKAGGDDRKAL